MPGEKPQQIAFGVPGTTRKSTNKLPAPSVHVAGHTNRKYPRRVRTQKSLHVRGTRPNLYPNAIDRRTLMSRRLSEVPPPRPLESHVAHY